MVSYQVLKRVAVGGAVAVIATGLYLERRIQLKFSNEEYFRKSMKMLRESVSANIVMDQPIWSGRVNLRDEFNYANGLKAKIAIPVKGPKDRGTLYVWAERPDYKDEWTITRLELGLKSEPEKRLLIHDHAKA
ncbi:unnamed protein product [Darwinula stevensoni]|uniref:Cytochrome oxidase complex assembly protein 1 n=1 Tax=Darwinula stevensoni TaxID=69355 RepID=A0A7R9A2U2_9CRUS|nr:unnamed protein product [Darwinula stevensoni]CAG0886353.1 unnamed protein product [Darwinula stevensoni]